MGEGSEGSVRKTSRVSTATEKRKAADEGGEEQMKKRLKALEDKITKLTGTNTALTNTVRGLRKEKADAVYDTENDRGCRNDADADDDDDGDSDNDDGDDNSPMLFNARKIMVTSRLNPDAARQDKRLRQGSKATKRDLPPQRQDPTPEYQDTPPSPIPQEHANAPGRVDSPVGAISPTPPSQSRTKPTGSSGVHPLSRPVKPQVPPHPWAPALLAPGVDSKTPKTANRVYNSDIAGMLAEAQHSFECLLFVKDAYPDINTQIRWSFECWEAVCSKYEKYFELSKEMMNLIKGRCSHGRGAILQRVRPAVDGIFNTNTKSKAVVSKNAVLAKKLLARNAFYFADGVVGRRRFEDETVLRALQRAYFGGSKSCAAMNHVKFNPIAIESIALVCTIIEHCLREWEHGVQAQANLNEAVDATRYRTHIANTVEWKHLNEEKTTLVLKHISARLFESCGPKSKLVETTGSISQEILEQEKAMLEERSMYDTEEEI